MKHSALSSYQVRLDVKDVKETDETLTFIGQASVYDVVDLGGDVVKKGAFTKTVSEKPVVPILWQHDSYIPIGLGTLSEGETALMIEGVIEKGVTAGKDAAIYVAKKIVRGLSIGYQTIKADFVNSGRVRELQELKVWEVSLATFPMNPAAQILTAKNFDASILRWIDATLTEVKAGRVLSTENMALLEAAMSSHAEGMQKLTALYDAARAAADKAAGIGTEPVIHSIADQLNSLKEVIKWN